MDLLTSSMSALALVCAPLLLTAAALVLTAESGVLAGLILPGSSTVLPVGALVGIGRLPLIPSMIVLVLASTLGAHYGFRTSRRRAIDREPTRFLSLTTRVEPMRRRAQRLFTSNAAVGTVLAHMVGGTRTVGPRMAARSRMSYRTFAVLNAGAATFWVGALIAAGALVGNTPSIAPWFVGAAIVAALVAAVVQRRRKGTVGEPSPSVVGCGTKTIEETSTTPLGG